MKWPLSAQTPMIDGAMTLRPYDTERDPVDLFRALNDPLVWQHIPGGAPEVAAVLAARFAKRMADGLRSTWVIEVAGSVVGTSSFVFDPDDDAGLEIGSTYLSLQMWGRGINHRAKQLMLPAAFVDGAAWVQFRTDERNLRSAAAILKLGAMELPAREEQWIRADGTRRVSRFFRLFPGRWLRNGDR